MTLEILHASTTVAAACVHEFLDAASARLPPLAQALIDVVTQQSAAGGPAASHLRIQRAEKVIGQ
jgi:hypothetical protein